MKVVESPSSATTSTPKGFGLMDDELRSDFERLGEAQRTRRGPESAKARSGSLEGEVQNDRRGVRRGDGSDRMLGDDHKEWFAELGYVEFGVRRVGSLRSEMGLLDE